MSDSFQTNTKLIINDIYPYIDKQSSKLKSSLIIYILFFISALGLITWYWQDTIYKEFSRSLGHKIVLSDTDKKPQTLEIKNGKLYISEGNSVEIPIKDAQQLSIKDTKLTITNGNTIDLPEIDYYKYNTDNQFLQISGNRLYISGGNSVNLPSYNFIDKDSQILSFQNGILSLSGGNTVDLKSLIVSENDSIIGNEILGVGLSGGLIRTGVGTLNSPYNVDIIPCIQNQILKYNLINKKWECSLDENNYHNALVVTESQVGMNFSNNINLTSANGAPSLQAFINDYDNQILTYDQATRTVKLSGPNGSGILSNFVIPDDIFVDTANISISNQVSGSTNRLLTLSRTGGKPSIVIDIPDNDTLFTAGTGLSLDSSNRFINTGILSVVGQGPISINSGQSPTVSLNPCANGEVYVYNAGSWNCTNAANIYSFGITDNSNTVNMQNGQNVIFKADSNLDVVVANDKSVTYRRKLGSAMGSLEYFDNIAGFWKELPAGGVGQVLTMSLGVPSWQNLIDNVIGNEILDVGVSTGIVRSGAGTAISPYKVDLKSCASDEVMKFNTLINTWDCKKDNSHDILTNQITPPSSPTSIIKNKIDLKSSTSSSPDLQIILDDNDNQLLTYSASTGNVNISGPNGFGLLSTINIPPSFHIANIVTSSIMSGSTTHRLTLTKTDGTLLNIDIPDNDTLFTAGTGLSIDASNKFTNTGILSITGSSPINVSSGQNPTVSLNPCSNGEVYVYSGGSWNCSTASGLYNFNISDGTNSQNIGNANTIKFEGDDDIQVLVSATDTVKYRRKAGAVLGSIEYYSPILQKWMDLAPGTNGQVLTLNAGIPAWQTVAANNDNFIGNEIVDIGTSTGLVRLGTGISGAEYKVDIKACGSNEILKYNTTSNTWDCQKDKSHDTLSNIHTIPALGTGNITNKLDLTSALGSGAPALSATLTDFDNQIISYNSSTGKIAISGPNGIGEMTNFILPPSFNVSTISISGVTSGSTSRNLTLTKTDGTSTVIAIPDNDTLYTAGSGISIGATNQVINTGILTLSGTSPVMITSGQNPVVSLNACASNQIYKYNGSAWLCSTDLDAQTLTYNSTTNILGITNGNTVALPYLQVEMDATVGNELTNVGVSTALVRAGSGTVGSPYTVDLKSCANSEILVYQSSTNNWICANNTGSGGTVTQISTGNGLAGGPITGSGTVSVNAPACTGTDKLVWTGTAFSCTSDIDTDTTTFTISANSGGTQTINASNNVNFNNGTGLTATRTANSIKYDLSNTGVVAGTYNSVTVDAQGRVTSATNSTEVDGVIGNEVFEIIAGSGISLSGTKALGYIINTTLGTNIDSSEIVDGTISTADYANNSITLAKLTNCASDGQILKYYSTDPDGAGALIVGWNCTSDADSQTLSLAGTTLSISNGNSVTLPSDSDGIVGNEITNVDAGSGLTRNGTGTAVDPYRATIRKDCFNGQILKWNLTLSTWECSNDSTVASQSTVKKMKLGPTNRYYTVSAIMQNDTLMSWSYGANFDLGLGANSANVLAPKAVPIPETITEFIPGYTSNYILGTSGKVYSFGQNNYGQLGVGDLNIRYVATEITTFSSGSTVTSIVSSGSADANTSSACALRANGTVWCWGYNGYGQLGDGTTVNKSIPVQIAGISTAVSLYGSGGQYGSFYAILADGTARSWGYNGYGQLGNNTTTSSSVPVVVSGLSNATKIVNTGSGSYGTACALRSTGAVMCWGYNGYGQIGDGSVTQRNIPTAVLTISTATDIVMSGDSNTTYMLAKLADNTLRTWGYNGYGQLGDGSVTARSTPVNPTITNVSKLASQSYHACVIKTDSTLWCTGYNGYGQLGNGDTVNKSVFTQVVGINDATDIQISGTTTIAWTCALTIDNIMKCWGYNVHGELGDGTTTNQYVPALVKF